MSSVSMSTTFNTVRKRKQKLNKVINISVLFWNLFQKFMKCFQSSKLNCDGVGTVCKWCHVVFRLFFSRYYKNYARFSLWEMKKPEFFGLSSHPPPPISQAWHHLWTAPVSFGISSNRFQEIFVQTWFHFLIRNRLLKCLFNNLLRSRQVMENWTKANSFSALWMHSHIAFSSAHHHISWSVRRTKQIVGLAKHSYLFRALILTFAFCAFTFEVTNKIAVKSLKLAFLGFSCVFHNIWFLEFFLWKNFILFFSRKNVKYQFIEFITICTMSFNSLLWFLFTDLIN